MTEKIKIVGYQRVKVELEITKEDLGCAILGNLAQEYDIDDAGCDWCTYDGKTFIGDDHNWCVSRDENFSKLVDAANILIYGHVITLSK